MGATGFVPFPDAGLSPESLIQFALTQDLDMVIVGCSTPEEARSLAGIGRPFRPMNEDEEEKIVESVRPYAKRLAFYRGAFMSETLVATIPGPEGCIPLF